MVDLNNLTDINSYDWTLDNWGGRLKIFFVILCSFFFFLVLQYTVRFYLFGKCSFKTFDYFKFVRSKKRRGKLPSSSNELEVVPPNKKWRIANETLSLIHSVISGFWALFAIISFPLLITEINTFNHPMPKFLIYISFGYLVHDLVDLLINERSVRIIELLFHHVIVICGFLLSLITELYLGVVMLGLLMECNSIFLHARSLLNLYRQPKNSVGFRFVALLNIVTFVIFRIAVSLYLVYWQMSNMFGGYFNWAHTIVTFVVVTSLAVTNFTLFYRVLTADGLLGKEKEKISTDSDNSTDFDCDSNDKSKKEINQQKIIAAHRTEALSDKPVIVVQP